MIPDSPIQAVMLTNLGYLTLDRLAGLRKRYEENTPAKRAKLASLWGRPEDLPAFEALFADYMPEGADNLILRTGGKLWIANWWAKEALPLLPGAQLSLDRFQDLGLISYETMSDTIDSTVLKLKRGWVTNPLRHLSHLTIELTGLCNLRCRHCYRGGSRQGEYGLPIDTLEEALIPLLRAGIHSVGITGGEPTVRKADLLELVSFLGRYLELKGVSKEERYIYHYGTPDPVAAELIKTGWYERNRQQMTMQLSMRHEDINPGDWNICDKNTPADIERYLLEMAQFMIEARKVSSFSTLDNIGILTNAFFDGQREFVKALAGLGNIDLQTSLDSYDEHTTDAHRGRRGVFKKVNSLAHACKAAGIDLGITSLDIGGHADPASEAYRDNLDRFARVFEPEGLLKMGNAAHCQDDGAADPEKGNFIGGLDPSRSDSEGWCHGFTGSSNIHIRPTGSVGNCLYGYALPEEFGNVKERSMIDILNNVQHSRIHNMFRDGTIMAAQAEIDRSLFPAVFRASCEPMMITLTYAQLKERYVAQGDPDPIKSANLETAKIYKYL